MRRTAVSISLALLGLLSAPPAVAGEATRTYTLELQIPADGGYTVENLAGSMRVTRGTGDRLVAVATVHAESEAVLKEFRFEQVAGEKGEPTLRAVYPASVSTFRMPKGQGSEDSWLGRMMSWGNSSTLTYAGRRVKVSDSGGVLLYADVEVTLPARGGHGTFRNMVGALSGSGISGDLTFDVASADIALENLEGSIVADAGSGNITGTRISGSFRADAGSGNISVTEFDGDALDIDVGSGNVTGKQLRARSIQADTGSGNIRISGAATESFKADTGSGNVTLQAEGEKLASVEVDTGSGNVTLKLGDAASFEARASQASGELIADYDDAEPIVKGREVVGYRRGDGRTRIRVDTGSGNVTIEPGR